MCDLVYKLQVHEKGLLGEPLTQVLGLPDALLGNTLQLHVLSLDHLLIHFSTLFVIVKRDSNGLI